MECFFINLDGQPERREFLERNFAQHKAKGWFLTRIQAVNQEFVNRNAVPGIIRAGEKGCFLSHGRAIGAALEAPGHAMILEDDAMFGPGSCAAIARAVAQLPEDGWDLLFTDLSIYYAPLMTALVEQHRELTASGGQALTNMNDIAFCGSTAYVVNSRSKERVLQLISPERFEEPYDVFLRRLIREEKIRSLVTFPFATTVSEWGDGSTIQVAGTELERLLFNSFRRLMWVDRDIAAVDRRLREVGETAMDAESTAFSRLFGLNFARQLRDR